MEGYTPVSMREPPLLRHDRAGRAQPTFLGPCLGEANADPSSRIPGGEPAAAGLRVGALELSAQPVEVGEDALHLELRVHNAGSAPAPLAALRLRVLWTPSERASLQLLCQPLGPAALGSPGAAGWRSSELVAVAGAARAGPACLVGVLEGEAARGCVHLCESEGGVRFEADLQLDAVLQAGQSLQPGSVRVALGVQAHALLEDFAQAFGKQADARVTRPFFASALLAGADAEREVELRPGLEALAAAQPELGVDAVVVGGGPSGDWLSAKWREASELAALAAEIRGAGYIPGLRVSPLCVDSKSSLLAEHPDWLLEGATGPLRIEREREVVHVLDVAHPELLAQLQRVCAELAAQGFGFLEIDELQLGLLRGRAASVGQPAPARLRAALDAIRQGVGEEVFVLGCGAPLGAGVGRLDALRVSPPQRVEDGWQRDAGKSSPATAAAEMLDRAWMHRRMFSNELGRLSTRWGGAELGPGERSALATAWSSAGSLQLDAGWESLDARAREFLGNVLETARAVDRAGVPGALRVSASLSPGGQRHFEAVAGDGIHAGCVNPGSEALELPEAGRGARARLRAGEGPHGTEPPQQLAPKSGALWFAERAAPLAVFCDFDGTFSVQDVGATLARRHAGTRRPRAWARYERGEITPWDYNMEILDGLEVPYPEWLRFLREEIELDPGARHLLAWCDAHEVSFRILSDGFDWNLMELQAIHGIRLSCESNHLHYDRGRWRIRAGGPDASCGCGTGFCKGAALRRYRAENPERQLVHIGNGRVSDSCGALAADHAFAKDSLAESLRERGEPFQPFETLLDVIPALEALLVGA